jgi:predicted ATPase
LAPVETLVVSPLAVQIRSPREARAQSPEIHMRRFILTGAPGAGKTAILRALELAGHPVIEEAATDVIALEQANGRSEPWRAPGFIDAIVRLQKQRQLQAGKIGGAALLFDRSPVCTMALARFLGFPASGALKDELERIDRDRIYERRVFVIQSLSFMINTDARRISLEDAVRFGRLHEEAYLELGYELVRIAPGPVPGRAAEVARLAGLEGVSA